MNVGDRARFQKAASKILDIFSDGRIRDHDLMYVAFYTVADAYPLDPVVDRLLDYAEHVKFERDRLREDMNYAQDTLF